MQMEGLDVIFSYTRKQAIEDGVLWDVTDHARGMFKIPVAIGGDLIADIQNIPAYASGESVEGRLYDVLFCTLIECKKNLGVDLVEVTTSLSLKGGKRAKKFLAIVDGGDDGNAVMTLCYAHDR